MPVSALIGAAASPSTTGTATRDARSSPKRSRRAVEGDLAEPDRGHELAPFVVIVTTLVSTIFFALMDRFWGFVTNLVYGT